MLDHRLRVHARPGRRRTRASSASGPAARRWRGAARGSARRCSAVGCPRETRRALPRRCRRLRGADAGAWPYAITVDHSVKCARRPERTPVELPIRRAGRLDGMGMRLTLETSAARLVGRALARRRARRRHDAARASCSGRSTPARSTRSPRGCPPASASSRRRTARRRRARWLPDPRPPLPARLEQLRRQPRLGRRLHPALGAPRPSSACSRSTSSRCRR